MLSTIVMDITVLCLPAASMLLHNAGNSTARKCMMSTATNFTAAIRDKARLREHGTGPAMLGLFPFQCRFRIQFKSFSEILPQPYRVERVHCPRTADAR